MDKSQKKIAIAVGLLLMAGAIVALTMRNGGPMNTGEGTIQYRKTPPPDSAPLPADQGGTGVAPAGEGSRGN